MPTLPQADIQSDKDLDKAFLGDDSDEIFDQELEDEIEELQDVFASYLRCYKIIGK